MVRREGGARIGGERERGGGGEETIGNGRREGQRKENISRQVKKRGR